MARIVLTDAKVKALKPPSGGKTRRFLNDAHVPGLLVCVTSRGHKTFMLRARFPGYNNFTRRELGEVGTMTLKAAREKALAWHELLHHGIDPGLHEKWQRKRVQSEAQLKAQREQENSFIPSCFVQLPWIFDLRNSRELIGVYLLVKNQIVVYVGQSTSIYRRIVEHLVTRRHIFDSIYYLEVSDDVKDKIRASKGSKGLMDLEFALIRYYRPVGNLNNGIRPCGKDDYKVMRKAGILV